MVKTYKPTGYQKRRYLKYVDNVKDIRRRLKEEAKEGAFRIKRKGLQTRRERPDLILPEVVKGKKQFSSKQEFEKELKALSKFSSFNRYMKTSYKDTYSDLIADKINSVARQITKDDSVNLKPTENGRYIKEQEDIFPELKKAMQFYNKVQRMSAKDFNDAYFGGWITAFRHIYDELNVYGNIGGGDNASLVELNKASDSISDFYKSGRGRR